MKFKKALLYSILIVLVFSFASGTAWADDSTSSFDWIKKPFSFVKEKLTSFKDSIVSFSKKLSSKKPSTEKSVPLKEKLLSLKKNISFTNRLVYQYRSVADDKDSDFYEYWNLRGRNFFNERLDFYFSGRLHKDLDDGEQSVLNNSFVSIEDREESWQDQIYQLYVTIKDPKKHWYRLRLGRQYIEDTAWLHIDGGQLGIFEKKKISGRVFYGKPISYYSSTSGDSTTGFSVKARPWYGNKIRLTYVYYDDDSAEKSNERSTLDVWQRVGERTRTHGKLLFHDDKFQTAGADLYHVSKDGFYDLMLRIKFEDDLSDETREYSPLFSVLGNQEQYTMYSVRSNFYLKSWLIISPGLSIRRVDGSEHSYRNREFEKYDVTLNVEPFKYLSTSLTGNYWNVSDSDRFFGLTGEVDYHSSKKWNVAVGTSYMDYEYHSDTSVYSKELSPDVYTLYANSKIKITKSIILKLQLESEDNSYESDDSLRFRTSLTTRF